MSITVRGFDSQEDLWHRLQSVSFLRRRIDTIDKVKRPLSDYLMNESGKSCLVFRKAKHRLKSVPRKEEKPLGDYSQSGFPVNCWD
jgi:hypothetical protein